MFSLLLAAIFNREPFATPRIVVTDATFPQLEHERAVAARYGASMEQARCASPADVARAARRGCAAGAHRHGVRVAHVPEYATGEVADHTATLILTALCKILQPPTKGPS